MTTVRNPHERIEELMQRIGQLESERDEQHIGAMPWEYQKLKMRIEQLEAALRLIQSMAANDLDDYFDNVQSITISALAPKEPKP